VHSPYQALTKLLPSAYTTQAMSDRCAGLAGPFDDFFKYPLLGDGKVFRNIGWETLGRGLSDRKGKA
jgi:hypothetical protein